MFELRDYQDKAINDLRWSFHHGSRRTVLYAPTGAGKTVIAAQIVKGAVDKGRQVIFLAHRRELVNQASDKLIKFGVEHGILMSGEVPYGATDVQVVSIDTFRARCINTDKLPLPRADVIIVDEAHRSLAKTYLKIFDLYPDAMVLGLTATPIRSDGKGLGHVYEDMVFCPTIRRLTELGHLVPVRTFAPTIPDLTGVSVKRGDYDPKELEAALNKRSLVGDVVSHWFRLAESRPTIVFASGVKHSVNLRDEFVRQGVPAAHVDGETPITQRNQIISELKVGKIKVVCNYGVLTEGFDEPTLSCCILARSTKNLGLYLQMAGRTLRPSDKKEDTILIDHSGNVYEHGFVSDEHDWVLAEGKALKDSNEERQKKLDERKPITCVKCASVYTGQRVCPFCGHVPEKRGEWVESRSGDLMEVREEKRRTAKKREFTTDEKRCWFAQLKGYAEMNGKKPGWAAHTFRAKFGVWPNHYKDTPAVEPKGEVLGYIRHRQIKYAKTMEKRNAENKGSSAR
jgi:superfamily II DNA or RNA helicase